MKMNELINYTIGSKADAEDALMEIQKHIIISQRIYREVMEAALNPDADDYLTMMKARGGGFHGISVVTNDLGEKVFTYYQFS